MRNVVGILTGSDAKPAEETVVVGAHLDHVGRMAAGAKHPERDVIFNGADDNASGVAAMLGMARALSQGGVRPKRTIVFVAFDGEEQGLFGSRHYVSHPARPLEKTAAMINLDMVGRLNGDDVAVYGTGTGEGLKEVVGKSFAGLRVKARPSGGGMIASDGMPFTLAGVPTLFFHTGVHGDYHRVTDEAGKINYEGLAEVARGAARTALALADAGERPKFVNVALGGPVWDPKSPVLGVAVGPGADGGLEVQMVAAGSGAQDAGLERGDVVTSLDGAKVRSFEELAEAVQRHKVGEKVKVAYRRGEKEETVEVTLKARGQ